MSLFLSVFLKTNLTYKTDGTVFYHFLVCLIKILLCKLTLLLQVVDVCFFFFLVYVCNVPGIFVPETISMDSCKFRKKQQ